MSCPIDFPFHVSLTLLPLHPPEMVTPALLHTSAHTTPGYTLCPCAHSRWSGGGSPLGQEWAEDLKEKKEKVEEKAGRKERKKEVVEEEENGAEEEEEETAEDGEEEDEGDEEG
ncbi:parathymosin isoform X2 [Bos javanicus]|uniref:parathymosin isoform X2 n=1 Tax=Bos javanicus TaxID=9906 RepID=UPI002AA6D04D|nr:parathymosin isoform X2 [Bos javanicus]